MLDHGGGVVQVAAAELVEADDCGGLKAAGGVEDFHHRARVEREGVAAGDLFGVGIAGQAAFGEADDLNAVVIGALEAVCDLGEVGFELTGLGFELEVADSHW